MYALTHHIRRGVILEWFGTIASIPAGWAFCDGTNGTPDLRDTVPVGAKQDDGGCPKTNMTGSLTASGGNIDHTHVSGADVTVADGVDHDAWDGYWPSSVNNVVPFPYKARVFMMKL